MNLFSSDSNVNLLPFDGIVRYFGSVFSPADADAYFECLWNTIEWRNDEANMFGRHIITKRKVAWYGDVDLVPHLLGVFASGAVDVTVSWGAAVSYGMDANRKEIAREAENAVRRMTARALRSPAAQPSGSEEAAASAVPAFEQT